MLVSTLAASDRFINQPRQNKRSLISSDNFVVACFFFCTGFLIGHFYGTLGNENFESPSLLAPTQQQDGWKDIHVFYGSNDHMMSLLPEGQKWFSQARQDEAIFSLLGGKRNGFFVDLAANDATTLSNTFILERDYDWKGLCIEPNPMYWYNLTHYRPNCELVAAVVGERRMEQISFRYNAEDHGGIAGEGFDNGPKFKKESTQEYTVSLLEIFEKFDVPRIVDYLSLDVEGAEEFIMRTFPLETYKVRLLTVERPKDNLRSLLESNGYQQIQRLSRWGETLWTHRDFHGNLDLSDLESFNAKKQYLAEKARKEKEEKS